jgi:glycosyltransferase involved in cell wall biosynthesis
MTIKDGMVSIVIPVHNGERFIGRTLASAQAQTYDCIETVVIDDGSTDQTAVLVESAVARDDRIRLFRTKRLGVAAARNFGIDKAQGEFIAPLDADDLWHPQKIARQVGLMRASPAAVGLVYCWSIDIDERDFVIPLIDRLEPQSTVEGRISEVLARDNIIASGSSPLIKRSCIDAVGGYDPGVRPSGAEDWKLYLTLSEICEFKVVRDYLVGYRQSTGSMSRDVRTMAQSMENVTRWIFEKWPNLPDEVRNANVYNTCAYLARKSMENSQFTAALKYQLMAYKARPGAFLERSNFEFGARILTQMLGIRQMVLRRRSRKAAISFNDLHDVL